MIADLLCPYCRENVEVSDPESMPLDSKIQCKRCGNYSTLECDSFSDEDILFYYLVRLK